MILNFFILAVLIGVYSLFSDGMPDETDLPLKTNAAIEESPNYGISDNF